MGLMSSFHPHSLHALDHVSLVTWHLTPLFCSDPTTKLCKAGGDDLPWTSCLAPLNLPILARFVKGPNDCHHLLMMIKGGLKSELVCAGWDRTPGPDRLSR